VKFHPLSEIFPLMQGREFDELVADIRANGLREPIWTYQEQILDGRNRWRASKEAGLTDIPQREYSGSDPVGFVVSLNLHRRHLDESQRGVVARRLATVRQGARTDLEPRANLPEVTQEQAAELLNVGLRTVKTAGRVLDNGDPSLVSAVERGEVSVSAAADVAELPKEQQREIVARGEKEILAAARRLREEKKKERQLYRAAKKAEIPDDLPRITERYTLLEGDLLKAGEDIPDNSVDWIITDPPYPKEFLPVYESLSELGARVLRPGGSLLMMVGQSYLPDVIRLASTRLAYYWTLTYLTPGGQSPNVWTRRVNTFWKPVLWFVKGEYNGDKVGDVIKSPPNANDKEHHDWGQSEGGMTDLIERFTYPGQMILDPFVGGGTTGLVAVRMNRRFIGIDIDGEAVKVTAHRLQELSRGAELVA